eukprot:TRINITY_DN100430_c0_g1_i1.p1 TRINITY_DN100430_c0_g1~~TRINITY_DN100430_c0_g1_i1.p1  ORF type:complete len:581 (+),score=175.00 TRINITY_DN100430_c0_g1_i1:65-1807(+)
MSRTLDGGYGNDTGSDIDIASVAGEQRQHSHAASHAESLQADMDFGSLISFANLENVMRHIIKKFRSNEQAVDQNRQLLQSVHVEISKRASVATLEEVAAEMRTKIDSFSDKIKAQEVHITQLESLLERSRSHVGTLEKKIEDVLKQKSVQERLLRETQDALLDKVAVSELNLFEAKFAGYTTKLEYQELLNHLSNYTRTDVSERIAESVRVMGTKFEEYTRTAQIDRQMQEMREWVRDELQDYAKSSTTLTKFEEFQNQLRNQALTFERMHAMVDDKARALSDRITSIYQEFYNDIQDRALQIDLKEMKDEMSKFSLKLDMEVFQQDCMPKLKFCVDSIKLFDSRLIQQDDAIRRVDEVLLDKAGKYDVVVLNSRIENCAQKERCEVEFQQMNERIGWMDKRVEQYISAEQDRLSKYKPPDYSGVFEELRSRIALKADKADLVEMYQLKANRIDADELSKLQELIHRQLEYLAVTTFGLSKLSLTEAASESKSMRTQQKSQVLRQCEALWHWIMHNEPPSNLETMRPGTGGKQSNPESKPSRPSTRGDGSLPELQPDGDRRRNEERKRAQLERKLGMAA